MLVVVVLMLLLWLVLLLVIPSKRLLLTAGNLEVTSFDLMSRRALLLISDAVSLVVLRRAADLPVVTFNLLSQLLIPGIGDCLLSLLCGYFSGLMVCGVRQGCILGLTSTVALLFLLSSTAGLLGIVQSLVVVIVHDRRMECGNIEDGAGVFARVHEMVVLMGVEVGSGARCGFGGREQVLFGLVPLIGGHDLVVLLLVVMLLLLLLVDDGNGHWHGHLLLHLDYLGHGYRIVLDDVHGIGDGVRHLDGIWHGHLDGHRLRDFDLLRGHRILAHVRAQVLVLHVLIDVATVRGRRVSRIVQVAGIRPAQHCCQATEYGSHHRD